MKVGIAETVAQAMAESEYSDEVYDKVEMLKVKAHRGLYCIVVKTTSSNNLKLRFGNKRRLPLFS